MKLLLDENLSRRIVPLIQEAYPDSSQVVLLGMESANDEQLWEYAKQHHYILVTQDSDFHDLSALYGHPPKIIWLKCGNQPRQRIVDLLVSIQKDVRAFVDNADLSCLEVYGK